MVIKEGSVVVIPTDTVYGIACLASDKEAVKRLYEIKGRSNKPGTIIAANINQLENLGIKRRYLKAVEHLWPGPVSVVVPSEPEHLYLDLGAGTLAVRVVSDKRTAQLLEKTGPMLTSSANLPGDTPANTIAKAKKYFGNQVDEYIDGGDLSDRKPSTIVRVVDDVVEVLREGSVKINEKGEVENEVR